MNSNHNGELRLADGTLVCSVGAIDIKLEHDPLVGPSDFPRYDLREAFNRPSLQATGTLTLADIGALLDLVPDHYLEPEICVYVPQHRYWQLEYARQGRWYPRPRRSKSQARMSKKWRDRA